MMRMMAERKITMTSIMMTRMMAMGTMLMTKNDDDDDDDDDDDGNDDGNDDDDADAIYDDDDRLHERECSQVEGICWLISGHAWQS